MFASGARSTAMLRMVAALAVEETSPEIVALAVAETGTGDTDNLLSRYDKCCAWRGVRWVADGWCKMNRSSWSGDFVFIKAFHAESASG